MVQLFIRCLSILVLSLNLGCSSVVYIPRVAKTRFYDPAKFGLKQEEIDIPTSQGIKVHAWWFKSKTAPAKGTVVFFHGNAENISTHFLSLSWLPAEGYNYLIWDYPGYGDSEGEPSPENNVVSAHAVLEWVHKNKDDRPLIIYGHSTGGIVAMRSVLDTKDQIPYKVMVVDGSFCSFRSVARVKASQSWLLWLLQPVAWLLMNDEYAPKKLNEMTPIPLLVIHGQKDIVVPPQLGEDIYKKASEPKEIWRIADGNHGDTFWAHEGLYRKKFLEYIEGLH
jgi:fermentation-respiration switch protein FrsA (DUF1100 family)